MNKRVLIVFESMGLGGVETHVLSIIEMFHKEYDFYLVAKDGDFKDKFKKYSKKILNLDFYNQDPDNIIENSELLIDFINKNKIDVIHIHQYLPYYPVLLAYYATGVPYVITIHSFLFPEDDWRNAWGDDFVRFWEKIVFPNSSKLIFISKQHKQYWLEKFSINNDKTCVIPNFINIGDYKYKPCFGEKHFMALRVSHDKRPQIDTAIELIKYIRRFNENANLTIAGDGELLAYYKDITKEKSYIKFIGFKNDISNIIREYDVILGSGRVAIEAIASGKKVVSIGPFGMKGVISPNNFNKFSDVNFNGRGLDSTRKEDVAVEINNMDSNMTLKNYEKLLRFIDSNKLSQSYYNIYNIISKKDPNAYAYNQLVNQILIVDILKNKLKALLEVNDNNSVLENSLNNIYKKNNMKKKYIYILFTIVCILLTIIFYHLILK